ncbi:MAG: D-sedoheptulose 7-phosphate isomerase [archaeon]
MKESIKKMLKESADLKMRVADKLSHLIEEAAKKIIESYAKGGKLVLFGNGGSAADAQHLEAELVHQFEKRGRRCLLAISLTTNTSVLTAIGNDWEFNRVFERQIEGLVGKNDVVIGLSTSGNSENVIKGIEQAKKNGAYTIAFTGRDGGRIKEVSDLSLIVPSDNTARIQEAHITIGHILCKLIEDSIFEND